MFLLVLVRLCEVVVLLGDTYCEGIGWGYRGWAVIRLVSPSCLAFQLF